METGKAEFDESAEPRPTSPDAKGTEEGAGKPAAGAGKNAKLGGKDSDAMLV